MIDHQLIHVSVVVCTFMRNQLLKNCLENLISQDTSFNVEIIVVDNDALGSACNVVEALINPARLNNVNLKYCIEPIQNISIARNRGVHFCIGEFIAFIDDDEYPEKSWLENLYKLAQFKPCDGIFGPVIPIYPEDFPVWIRDSGIFDRPRFATGKVLGKWDMRTGNALVLSRVLKQFSEPFDIDLGKTGGEDSYLFAKLYESGHTFLWCDEAIVYEVQDIERADIKWHITRGYRGGWCFARNAIVMKGYFMGTPIVLSVALLGSIRVLIKTLSSYRRPRLAILILCRGVSGQLGKLGYFFGFKKNEYEGRNS